MGSATPDRTITRTQATRDALDISEKYGMAKITVRAIARAGQSATVHVEDRDYTGTFDRSGTFVCKVAVPKGNEQIYVDLADGTSLQGHATGADLAGILLFVLRWDQPVDFALSVLAPGEPQPIDREHPVGQKGDFLDIGGCGSGWHEEVFAVIGRDQSPNDVYTFRLDYRSRGDFAIDPYCQGGRFAAPEVEVVERDRTQAVKTWRFHPSAAQCEKQVPAHMRLERLEPY
jgi:uncharacterized protein YfaP (DUF2135 family)